jgi:hypothetical protein
MKVQEYDCYSEREISDKLTITEQFKEMLNEASVSENRIDNN